jgi:hypothetical protein
MKLNSFVSQGLPMKAFSLLQNGSFKTIGLRGYLRSIINGGNNHIVLKRKYGMYAVILVT